MPPSTSSQPSDQDETGITPAVGPFSNLKISSSQATTPSPAIVANLVANISPDVHARIEAFQNLRSSKNGPPLTSGVSTIPPSAIAFNNNSAAATNSSSGPSGQNKHNPGGLPIGTTNIPHPDSPKAFSNNSATVPTDHRQLRMPNLSNHGATYKTAIPDYSAFHKHLVSQTQQQPTAPETASKADPSVAFSGAIFGQMGTLNSRNTVKPSLSDRRGMKLSQTAIPSVPLSKDTDGAETVLTSSTLPQVAPKLTAQGRRPNKAGLKLNLGGKAGQNNIFSNHAKYVDVKTGSLNFAGKASLHSQGIDFSSGSTFRISIDDMEPMGELGRGNYGTVTKVLHKPTNIIMAMKEIRLELEETKFSQIVMELEILHKCVSPYIVDFYGAFFVEGAVYVCMEYMDGGSLDKIYEGGVDEPYLAVITDSVVRGLKQLKDDHNIIHRDVKPTNILVSTNGTVKLCDFGVSGNLVASIARTNIGCQSYMAPERIKSVNPNDAITYTVQSDIWSLGLSILEVAKGSYPYPPETYKNIFSQLSAIVDGKPPTLPADKFSPISRSFVDACLNKVPEFRPTYAKLLAHPWLSKYRNENVNVGEFVKEALKRKEAANLSPSSKNHELPALHRGSIAQPSP